jgi:hypothetical protein
LKSYREGQNVVVEAIAQERKPSQLVPAVWPRSHDKSLVVELVVEVRLAYIAPGPGESNAICRMCSFC